MANYTKTNPQEKRKLIEEMKAKIRNNQVRINDMATMEGYKLIRPIIRAKNDLQVDSNGCFDLKSPIFQEAVFEEGSWAVAYSPRVNEATAQECITELKKSGLMLGVILKTPYIFNIEAGQWRESLNRSLKQY